MGQSGTKSPTPAMRFKLKPSPQEWAAGVCAKSPTTTVNFPLNSPSSPISLGKIAGLTSRMEAAPASLRSVSEGTDENRPARMTVAPETSGSSFKSPTIPKQAPSNSSLNARSVRPCFVPRTFSSVTTQIKGVPFPNTTADLTRSTSDFLPRIGTSSSEVQLIFGPICVLVC